MRGMNAFHPEGFIIFETKSEDAYRNAKPTAIGAAVDKESTVEVLSQ